MNKLINILVSLIVFFLIAFMHPSIIVFFIKSNFSNLFKKKYLNENSKLIKEYSELGFTTFELSKKEIKDLNLYKKIINKLFIINKFLIKNIIIDKKFFYYTDTETVRHQLFFPSIEKILKKNLNGLFENILGKEYYITSFLWQRNMNFPEDFSKELYSNYWHYDFKRQEKRWCRAMIYLTDQEDRESIHLFDLKTSKKAFENELYGRYSEKKLPELIKNEKFISSPGSKGTIKIINTADLLHRAGHLSQGKVRDVFFVILQSKENWKVKPEFLLPPKDKIVNLH